MYIGSYSKHKFHHLFLSLESKVWLLIPVCEIVLIFMNKEIKVSSWGTSTLPRLKWLGKTRTGRMKLAARFLIAKWCRPFWRPPYMYNKGVTAGSAPISVTITWCFLDPDGFLNLGKVLVWLSLCIIHAPPVCCEFSLPAWSVIADLLLIIKIFFVLYEHTCSTLVEYWQMCM